MATNSRPGVYIQETSLPQNVALANNSTAVGALLGFLPKGPTKPTLVTSWSEFVKTYGSYSNSYPTTFGAYAFFANGGRNLFINRVVGSGADTATVTLTDSSEDELDTLRLDAVNPGAWGNDLTVEVKAGINNRFTLLVYGPPLRTLAAADSNVLEQFNDLTMDADDPRYAVSVINALSTRVVATDLNSESTLEERTPLAAGLKVLTGGAEGSAPIRADYADALDQFDEVQAPLVMNIPDAAHLYDSTSDNAANQLIAAKGIMADLMEYCETRGDCFAVVDTPKSYTAAEAISYTAALASEAAAGADGSNAAIYFPWLVISDPLRSTPGATRLLPPGAAMVGQYLATDATVGVFKAPAGLNNRVVLAVAPERTLTNSELDSLNAADVPVNAIRTVPGAGIVVMGARTMKNAPGDRYINVRRSMIYLKKELTDLTAFAIFENNDSRLWSTIRGTLNAFLGGYWAQGGLRGASTTDAFFVRCDSTNNTAADILSGQVNIEVGVALEYPAEFVLITIGQLTGSASVG